MALNKKMHPRNPYRTPRSFKDLALKNEEFRLHAKIEISGKVSIDFKNAEALRALTRALLKEDWGLDVVLPPEYLVPTLPLRLNYILWLEDIMSALKKDSERPVHGIDIGTGASCIYPLLAAKKNGWHMIGTEKNDTCFKHAQDNVVKNNLASLVKVHKVDGESILCGSTTDHLFDSNSCPFDFTMCNPPFFSSEEDLEKTCKSRSPGNPRSLPHNARTGSSNEVVVAGGEVAFVLKMVDESFLIKDKIRIFSTMLGHKSSFLKILTYLKSKGIQEVASTEFCQGHVTRWGLAWSHIMSLSCESPSLNLGKKNQKPKPPMCHIMSWSKDDESRTFDSILLELKGLMDQLNMNYKCVIKDKTAVGFQVTAFTNTWSNQRKRRRDQLKGKDEKEGANCDVPDVLTHHDTSDHCPDLNQKSQGEPPQKKAKISETEPLVVMGLTVKKGHTEAKKISVILEMNWLHGSGGRDAVHQIMQYFKNNLSATSDARGVTPK